MRLVVIAGAIAALVSLLGTPLLIRILARHGYAQAIRVSTDGETYPDHESKTGTPSRRKSERAMSTRVASSQECSRKSGAGEPTSGMTPDRV